MALTKATFSMIDGSIANIKDFGAVCDGAADDSDALQAAINSGASTVITEGTVKYTKTITVGFAIRLVNRGTLIYGGTYAASNPHFNVTADNVEITGGVFDGNGDIGSIIQFATGADYGSVNNARFKNLESKTALGSATGDFACVVLKGNYGQVHDCVFQDCINTDSVTTNDSFPRAITITGNYNTVSDVQINTVRCPIITTGDYNHIKDVMMDTIADNGFYYGGNNNLVDGVVMLNMADEPIVFSSGTDNTVRNCVIDNSETDEGMNAIGFQNAVRATIDGLVVRGVLKCGSLFKTRAGNTTSSGIIKNVNAKISGLYGVYAGTEGSSEIEFIDCNIEYVKQSGYDYNYFFRLDGNASTVKNCVFTMSDASGYASSGDTFTSGIVLQLGTKWVQQSGSNFRGYFAEPRFTTYRQNNINTYKSISAATSPREFWSSQAPTSGDWLQGDVIWNSAPTAGGTMGWVCVTAGTPGTWKTFGAIAV